MKQAPIAIVAGSGIDLLPLLDTIEEETPFSAIPALQGTTVAGHAGLFLRGTCQGLPVILQSGRKHVYEGLSYEQVVAAVDQLQAWGVQGILFTNAAGGLNRDYTPGTLMAIQIILPWPCTRLSLPDTLVMDWQSPSLDEQGGYAWVHGPCYETRAEIEALRECGGAVVGMSTAPEVQRCQELGIKTAGICCVTNACDSGEKLTHDEVVLTAQHTTKRLCEVLLQDIPEFAAFVTGSA